MSFKAIRTYIEDARTFYIASPSLKDVAPEDIEDRLQLLITQDINDSFKIGMGYAEMYYKDVLHPKNVYFVKQKVLVNSDKYQIYKYRHSGNLLDSRYGHYKLKECYPSEKDCMECWKYWSGCCSTGTNSMYGGCYDSSCMGYMEKKMPELVEGMNDENKIEILLTVRRLRMTDEQARDFELEDGQQLIRE
jgi:hypothetical protein